MSLQIKMEVDYNKIYDSDELPDQFKWSLLFTQCNEFSERAKSEINAVVNPDFSPDGIFENRSGNLNERKEIPL